MAISVSMLFLFSVVFSYIRAYPKKFDFKHYFTRRVGRIFPAYYLCIVVYSLLFANSHWDYNLLFAVFSLDLQVYPNAIGHLWFINCLLECYLLFPLLWYISNKFGNAGLFIVYLLCLLGGTRASRTTTLLRLANIVS